MKLKKLLSEIGVEQMKVYSNPYVTAFKPNQEDVNEAKKINPTSKRFLKGMKKIKVKGLGGYMPGVDYVYVDGDKYYFVDFEGDHMELKNISTIKQLHKLHGKSLGESVNEAVITYGIEYKSSKNDRKFKKASLTKTTHNPNIDKMMIKAISKDAKSLAKQDGWVDYRITKDGVPVKESVNENDGVYFKSYTAAIEAARAAALKKGFVVDDDEMFIKVGMNSKRPSVGKTTKVSLELTKNGKPQRKMLHIQVYGMKNGYELNSYIN